MPRRANPPKRELLARYQGDVRRSKRWREQQGYDRLWTQLIDFYANSYANEYSNAMSEEDRIAVNIAFSTINVIYPSISVNEPKIEVKANDPGFEQNAIFVEALLDYQWKHGKMQLPFRLAAKDYLVIGHGWTKVGWSFVEEEQEISPQEFADEFESRQNVVNEIAVRAPADADNLPSDEEIASSIEGSVLQVVEDQPNLTRVSPFDMYVNPEATHTSNMRYIFQRTLTPVEDIVSNENYDKKTRRELEGGMGEAGDTDPTTDPRSRENWDAQSPPSIEVYEFYDLVRGTVCKFTDSAKRFLVEPQRMPYAFGHPFEMLRNYDIPDMFYPIGDLEMIAPLQMELNKTRSEMSNYRAKFARKFVYRQNALSPQDVQKLTEKRDGLAIPVKDDSRPLEDIVAELRINNLDPNLFNHSAQIVSDIQEVSGVSEFARGGGGNTRRTATEAALIQDSLNARSADKLASVEDFITRIVGKILQLSQQFTTGDKVARIFGAEGATEWFIYNREKIAGEYDFSTEAGSTRPNNETFRRQQAISLAQILMPFVEAGIIDPTALATHILQEGFSIRNPEKFLGQGTVPNTAQQAAQQGAAGPGPANLVGPMGGGGPGLDANQPTPEERRESQESSSLIPGVPPELAQQLAGQTGI